MFGGSWPGINGLRHLTNRRLGVFTTDSSVVVMSHESDAVCVYLACCFLLFSNIEITSSLAIHFFEKIWFRVRFFFLVCFLIQGRFLNAFKQAVWCFILFALHLLASLRMGVVVQLKHNVAWEKFCKRWEHLERRKHCVHFSPLTCNCAALRL